MEVWDVLDKNGIPTGKTVERKKVCLMRGEYHLVVHIWILGSSGRVLIQRRSPEKILMPNEWAAIGGSAVSGEDPAAAAKRELFEEMGIDADISEFRLVRKMVRKNSIINIYLICRNTPLSELVLQKEEVSDAKWVHRNKLRQMIRTKEFHNYGNEYFDAVFGAFDKKSASKRRKKRYERKARK